MALVLNLVDEKKMIEINELGAIKDSLWLRINYVREQKMINGSVIKKSSVRKEWLWTGELNTV